MRDTVKDTDKVTQVTLFTYLLTDSSPVPMLRDIVDILSAETLCALMQF